MRVMLDTNVLISLLLFPSQLMNTMIEHIVTEHELVLSSFVVEELKDITGRKFPAQIQVIEKLLLGMNYQLIQTPEEIDKSLFSIRDMNDYPVIYSALISDVDVFITGDKDITSIEISKPEIVTPSEFVNKYITS